VRSSVVNRATWIVTALDAGFATAGQIKWKWLRDVFSLLCTGYYLLFANEADEKVSHLSSGLSVDCPPSSHVKKTKSKTQTENLRFRLLLVTQIPSNLYCRDVTDDMGKDLESLHQVLYSQRSSQARDYEETFLTSSCWIEIHVSFSGTQLSSLWASADHASRARSKPLTAYLFYSGDEASLAKESDLIMDIPGGGFICMNPEHHAERLLRWAKHTGRPVLSFDYGKVSLNSASLSLISRTVLIFERRQAPEYPYPFAVDEMFDAYSLLHSTKGNCIGMNLDGQRELRVVLTGDSAWV